MEIILAPHAGFCYGVKNALKKAEAIRTDGIVYTHGELIHNQQEIDRLKAKGIVPVDDPECIGEEDFLVIRSHGVGKAFYDRYGSRANLVDATCPSVKIAHRYAAEYSERGYQVVVFGEASHPEVQGILGWGGPDSVAVKSREDLERIDFSKPVLLLSQTTQAPEDFAAIRDLILEKSEDVVVKDTICNATKSRQGEIEALAAAVDVMIVIGGRHSSNSNKLHAIAKKYNPRTYFVETAADLKESWYAGAKKVGITAGASTPDWIIEEVVRTMSEEKMEKEQTMEELLQEMEQDVQAGDIVEGTVVQVGKENIVVDIGLKAEGILSVDEFEEGELPAVGDKIIAVLLQKSNNVGLPVLSKRKLKERKLREAQREALKSLPSMYENKEELEGRVLRTTKSGLVVGILNDVEAFLPASQIQVAGYAKNLDKYVGKTVRVRIIDLDLKKRLPKIVLSQKAILAEEKEANEKDFWETIEVGKVVNGVVKMITDFGAFINLGYMDGLLHVSEVSWNKRENLKNLLAVGDAVNVKIIAIDREKNKISLSLKALEEDPWQAFLRSHKPGHILTGTVTSIVDYGAFVSIARQVEGLLHVSEISNEKVEKPGDVLKVGQEIEVEILDIDENNRKVSLSKKSLEKPVAKPASEDKMVYSDEGGSVTLGDIFKQSAEAEESAKEDASEESEEA